MSSIIRTQKNCNYTVVSNGFVNDPNISAKAKGILVYLLSKPDDWRTRTEDIVNHMKDGIDSIKAGLKELKEAGYMTRRLVHNPETGQFGGWETLVFENPLPKVDFPTDGKTVRRENRQRKNPRSGNPPLLNTDLNTQLGVNCLDQPNTEKKEESGAFAPQPIASQNSSCSDPNPEQGNSSIQTPTEPSPCQSSSSSEGEAQPPQGVAAPPSQPKPKKRKRATADEVYASLQDRDSYEKLWTWYCKKCRTAGANPGDKVAGAEAWRDRIELDPDVKDRFKRGCSLFFKDSPTHGIPHLAVFISGKVGHPTPYWESAIEQEEASKAVAEEFDLGPHAKTAPTIPKEERDRLIDELYAQERALRASRGQKL